ncbi:MAG TPA: UvrD-helicase domain-containing protein [Gaiellaceae bacterium]|nr:UvrD-helicase domain-containing protein [Gaiellaceae bacterium]
MSTALERTAAGPAAALNEEQLAAVEAAGTVFVSAGAGTGKTSVLVERYVRAVTERGLDVDSILVITYTRKAAGELRTRIRRALLERGRPDLARELDGAWISTIHGFCNRLLKAHPFAVGLDPRFRELEDAGAAVLKGEAFERALAAFCAAGDPERLRLLATYRADGLRRMLTGVYETLRSAGRELVLELGPRPGLAEAVQALREEAELLAADAGASDDARGSAREALRIVAPGAPPERLVDLSALQARGSRAASFEQARKAVERAALEDLAAADRDLLQELLERFAAEYAAAKRRESVVDFEDLQLAARELLRGDEAVRDAVRLRFRLVMVDEFQDTNRLQCELIDLAVHPEETEVFTVGDEFQSIYGFRHADVEVFRERRAQAANLHTLRRNYRSRPQVLAAVNFLFAGAFGDEYQPLAASATFADPVFGHPVELLVTDKSSFRDAPEHWRQGEARAIALRVRALVDAGEAQPGEIVVLFAAGTDAERYEEALRREGLPTYRATGRGYFGQQQVVDVLAYLRLLRNRYDDVALVTVLASPFVGVSNDALVLLRRAAPRRPLFTALERTVPEGLSEEDERLLLAFRQRYERLVRASSRIGLEPLIERVVAEHDYDLAVLARWDGARRFANVRKLGRLAREYEALRGADLAGFVRFVREQDAVGARELEAVAEEEGADAVRLLTIHAAKGLEFKVVIVADAGRDTGRPRGGDEIVALSDGRFGFKMVHPTRGERKPVFGYEQVREAEREQERAERLRLYYVAMTRAIDRLIVSGAIDPERRADRETPIGWVLDRLGAHEAVAEADESAVELERGEARFLLRVERYRAEAGTAEAGAAETAVATGADGGPADEGQLALFGDLPEAGAPVGLMLPALPTLPEPSLHDVRRLSYSALALFERCSYRYFAERVLGLAPARRPAGGEGGGDALAGHEIGDAVHRLLEAVPLERPAPPPRPELEAAVRAWYPGVTAEELDHVAALVAAYCESGLARRVAELPGAAVERPFAFEHDGVLLHGRLDVLWRDGPRALVVDYKSNVLGEEEPRDVVEAEYRLQRLVYALACLRDGASQVEVAYQFLERPEDVVSAGFTAEDLPALEAELSAAIARIRAADFRPTPGELVCSDCPALDLVCAGPRLPLRG